MEVMIVMIIIIVRMRLMVMGLMMLMRMIKQKGITVEHTPCINCNNILLLVVILL